MLEAAYLFALCWLLAQVEIQIEGPRGWAEGLPTWRLDSPALLRWTNGKAVTGYHVYLTLLLIAFFHLPVIREGFSRQAEAKALSSYLFATFVWDFQWFAWNPAWGLKRFFKGPIPWFPRKLAGFPVDYFVGAAASVLATALLWPEGMGWWLRTAAVLAALSALSAGAAALRSKTAA